MEKTLGRIVHYVNRSGERKAAIVVHETASEDRATLFVFPHGEHNDTGAVIEYNVLYDDSQQGPHSFHFEDDVPAVQVVEEIEHLEESEAAAAGESEDAY